MQAFVTDPAAEKAFSAKEKTPVFELCNISCIRGERLLYKGLKFACPKGTLVRIAGPNGTGKTTLLRLIVGLMQPTEGCVQWKGLPVKKLKEEFWRDLVYVGHLNGVKSELTARENLLISSEIAGRAVSSSEADSALAKVGLAGFEDIPAAGLSQGQKRRVALARLYLSRQAPLWVLDEPFTALDVKGVANLALLISEHVRAGGIVIFTTHQEVEIDAPHSERIELSGGRWLKRAPLKETSPLKVTGGGL